MIIIKTLVETPETNLKSNIQLPTIQSESIPKVEYLSNTVQENLPSTSVLVTHPGIIINVKSLEQSNDLLSTTSNARDNPSTIINVTAFDEIEQCQSPERMPTEEETIPTPEVVNMPLIIRIKVMLINSNFFKFCMKKPLEIWGFITLLIYVFGLWFDTLR